MIDPYKYWNTDVKIETPKFSAWDFVCKGKDATYLRNDQWDALRYVVNNSKEKEKEMLGLKDVLRTIRNEVDDMAERYGLSMSTDYDTCTDKMRITCGKITRARAISDDIWIRDLRLKTAGQVLEIIERWLVDVFDVNPDRNPVLVPAIKNVIHNDPATIVFWADNSKTVVKCQEGDIYDPEKGLAMAISKKALGNRGNYCNTMKKWLPEEDKQELTYELKIDSDALITSARGAAETIRGFTLKAADIGAVLGKGRKK